MFRCSNVGTLQMGAARNMAMRITSPGSICWSRVGGSVAQRAVSEHIGIGSRRSLGALRADAGGARSYAAHAAVKNNKDYPTRREPAQRRHMARNKGMPSLLEIAKQGTSPKNREQKEAVEEEEDPEKPSIYDDASGADRDGIAAAEKELPWLNDPLALADRVESLLRGDDARFAATLVRMSQKQASKSGMNITVAWNHLIRYCLEANEPQAAWKFYNEMKKRGTKPNERTYTIMLTGLGKCDKQPGFNNVKVALRMYEAIFDPSTNATLAIRYANAMLSTCLRQGDFRTLWSVASDLPQTGHFAPNKTTYTIILRAIRDSLERDLRTMSHREVDNVIKRRHQAVVEAKKVWAEVAYLWKAGRLPVDSHLVSGMAHVLLEGSTDYDCYDVFSLYSQVCGIPVFAKEPPREVVNRRDRQMEVPEERNLGPITEYIPFVDEGEDLYRPEDKSGQVEGKGEEGLEEDNFDSLFDPLVTQDAPAKKDATALESASDAPATEPAPAAETLSAENPPMTEAIETAETIATETSSASEDVPAVGGKYGDNSKQSVATHIPFGNWEITYVLEACILMNQALGAGKAYWQCFMERKGDDVELNSGTCHRYLRLLRKSHSSRHTLELIRDQMAPAGLLEGKTFHIALSCCRRDRNNPNVFKIANEMLQIMDANLVIPDPRALEGYLDFIQGFEENPQRLMTMNGLEVQKSQAHRNLEVLGRELRVNLQLIAVTTLGPHISKLHEAMQQDTPPANAKGRLAEGIRDHGVAGPTALKAMVRTRGLIDVLLKRENASLISKEARKMLEVESLKLRGYSSSNSREKFGDSVVIPSKDHSIRARKRKGQSGH